jgi:polar amino acid transport system substrate-binding protein
MTAFLKFILKITVFYFISCNTHSLDRDLRFITLDVAPWAYYDQQTERYAGVFPDLIQEIERRTHYTIEISLVPYSFDRINRELELGRQDCTMVIVDKKRRDITIVGESVFDLPMGVMAKKEIALNDYEDLSGITISVLKELTEDEKFMDDDRLIKEFDLSYESGLRKIQYGRVDAIAGALPTINYLAIESGVKSLLGKPLVLSVDPIFLQCSKKTNPESYMGDVNKAIKTIKDDFTLRNIMEKNMWKY